MYITIHSEKAGEQMYLFQESKIISYRKKWSIEFLQLNLAAILHDHPNAQNQIWDEFHRPLIRSLTDDAEQSYTRDWVHLDNDVFQKNWLICFLQELLQKEDFA